MKENISLDSLIKQESKQALRGDAAQNRELLLETAVNLFNQHGTQNVTMADIAKAAGVGKGTLYRKFANKAELCYALMDTQLQTFQNGMIGRMRQLAEQGKSPMEMLDQFMDGVVHFTADNLPLLCQVRNGQVKTSSDSFSRPHYWMNQTVQGLLSQAVENGEISADLDTQYTADALIAPLDAHILQVHLESGFTRDRISNGLRALAGSLRTA